MPMKVRIFILAVVFIFVFCWVRDFCIKSLIGSVASNITGAPTRVGGLSLSVIRQSVEISNFRMYNPKGFARDVLVDIPKMGVAYNLVALISGKIHLRQIDLEIKEIGMVKNKEGRLNVDALKIATEKSEKKEKKGPAKQLAMQIDIVNLGMGRVVSRDYSVEGQAAVKVYDINLKKTYKHITSAQQLAALIISEPLKAAGIQGFKMYGASMLTGMAALPVTAAFTFAGKSYAQQTFNVTLERAYAAGLEVLKTAGRVKKEDRESGVISAEVNAVQVTLKLKKLSGKSTQVTISGRKFGLPQPNVASGVLYQLHERLK